MTEEIISKNTLEHGATIAGLGIGAGVASSIGGMMGTVFTVGSITVGAATPVGWLIAGGIVGGAALKLGSKLIGKKGESNGFSTAMDGKINEINLKKFQKIAAKMQQAEASIAIDLLEKVKNTSDGFSAWADEMKEAVKSSAAQPNEIITLSCEILHLPVKDYLKKGQMSIDELNYIVLGAVVMMGSDGNICDKENTVVIDKLIEHFPITDEDASFVLNMQSERYDLFHKSVKSFHPLQLFFSIARVLRNNEQSLINMLELLNDLANADGSYDENEKHIYHTAQSAFKMALLLDKYEEKIFNFPYSSEDEASKDHLFLQTHSKFEKKQQCAIKYYATGILPNYVIAVYDSTLFGGADKGFIINDSGLVMDNGEMLFFNDIAEVNNDKDKKLINISTEEKLFSIPCASEKLVIYLKQFETIN